ncbi:MAG TPA: type II toxin-antitoxin system PemK/MazF family toxin [Candidatus Krumholzibacterium sp.]|nr:type II toxin-antitoxin system PemK/MazF family toxin [Candidatus Krumholzibacterium sp.]
MTARRYIPERGDIVSLEIETRAGPKKPGPGSRSGRAARLPALVVSPREYNRKVGLAQFCPITSEVKGYPFEVLIPVDAARGRMAVSGAVLSDQIRTIDWRLRSVTRIARAPEQVVREVLAKVGALLGDPHQAGLR